MGRSGWIGAGALAILALAAGCAAPGPAGGVDTVPSVSSPAAGPSFTGQAGPVLGTTWYYTERINNDLPLRMPADPDAWIRFTDDTLTVNGTRGDRVIGKGEIPCPTLVLPATVTDGLVAFGKGAARVPDANQRCGARIGTIAPGRARVSVMGTELRISVDEGANKHVLVFSDLKPELPAVPTTVDLSFLAAPNDGSVQGRLANPLSGRDFVASTITGRTIAKPGISMNFGTDQVAFSSGCNGGSGGYTVDGSTISFTPGPWTDKGCYDERGKQETWLHNFTSGTAQFQLSGSTLTLTAYGETMVLDEKSADARSQHAQPVSSTAPTKSGLEPPGRLQGTVDEIVTPLGVQPLPTLEGGTEWNRPPTVSIETDAIAFDVGCGQLWSDTTGTFPKLTAGSYDGTWLLQCPPKRSALAGALRYILSGPLTIERDGAFLTITGRDGFVVNTHAGF